MPTLLFYINAINGGGAERVIIQLAKHFACEGYKSILVTSFVDKDNEYDIPENVIRLTMEEEQLKQTRLMRNLSRIKKLRKICIDEKPVALISFMAEPNFRSLIATIGLRTKCITSVRNDPKREYAGILGTFVGKFMLPQADGCVFQTNDAKSWFPITLQNKSKVIFNDVKEEFFEVQRKNTSNIVSIGRLSSQKNHTLLIKAFSKISCKFPNQKLLIYGEGILKNDLSLLIKSLGLEEKVNLMGATSDVTTVLANARVFVLASDYEGLPNCLMEALAAGVPSVSTDCPCGGPRSLITSGKNGILVPIQNVNMMAAAMEALLSNIEFAEKLGKNAKITAMNFHPNKIFSQWKEYVEEVIAR